MWSCLPPTKQIFVNGISHVGIPHDLNKRMRGLPVAHPEVMFLSPDALALQISDSPSYFLTHSHPAQGVSVTVVSAVA